MLRVVVRIQFLLLPLHYLLNTECQVGITIRRDQGFRIKLHWFAPPTSTFYAVNLRYNCASRVLPVLSAFQFSPAATCAGAREYRSLSIVMTFVKPCARC